MAETVTTLKYYHPGFILNMKQIRGQLTGRKAHPVIQFIKYGIAGSIVTVFGMMIFALLAWKTFPCLQEDELVVRFFQLQVAPMDEALRAQNFVFCKIIEFVLAVLLCYFINIAWVFERGKYSRRKEILLFYTLALISFMAGTALGAGLIVWLKAGTATAYTANLAAAVLINYAGRKYYIFKS